MKKSTFAIAFCAIIGLASFPAVAVESLEDVVKKSGYRLYKPPRENWGPGSVFLGKVKNGKLAVERAICPTLFVTVAPQDASVVLPDYNGTSDTDLGIGISLMEKVVGPNNSANLKASYKKPRFVDIKWGSIVEQSYFASSVYSPEGQIADIDSACKRAVDDVRRRKKMDRLFVIDRAIKVSSLEYTFKRGNEQTPNGGNIGGDLNIAGIIKVDANAGYSLRDTKTLLITKPLYIGYARPIRFEDFIPQSDVSGSRVKVRLSNISTDLIIE